MYSTAEKSRLKRDLLQKSQWGGSHKNFFRLAGVESFSCGSHNKAQFLISQLHRLLFLRRQVQSQKQRKVGDRDEASYVKAVVWPSGSVVLIRFPFVS